MTYVFTRERRRRFGYRNTHKEEGHVMMEAEIGVVQLPGKEHQALLGATRNWKKHARILS